MDLLYIKMLSIHLQLNLSCCMFHSVAKSQKHDADALVDIHRQYGDHLYK